MVDLNKTDPRFRFDVLAVRLVRRALELKAPSLLPVYGQVEEKLNEVAHDLLGPKAIERTFGIRVNKAVTKRSGKKKTAVSA